MTQYEFNAFDEAEQIEAFCESDVVVGTYSKDGFDYECRQISDVYAEYKSQGEDYVDMRSFRTTRLLDPYLNL